MSIAPPTNLRTPGAILLVSCYELGHPPHGLSLAAAFLERAGFRPATLDVAVESFAPEPLRAARCVAISVPMHTALRLGMRVARRVREVNPDCSVGFYGLYAPLHAAALLDGLADWVLGGEYEAGLVAEMENQERAGAALPRAHATSPAAIQLVKLDFPVPSRGGLPLLERYAQLEADGVRRLAGYVEASRGCLHTCRHCPIPAVYAGRFFVVPAAIVLQDIRAQVRAGATHITFGDPDFLNGPGHALRVARDLHREFPGVTFDFTAKIEHLLAHRDALPELAALGAIFVVTAVESLSDAVLEHLHKGHDRAGVETALRLLRAAGIAMRPSLLPFTPWSGLEEYADLLAWVEAQGLVDHVDPVQLTIRLLVPPGSLLLDSAAMRPFLGELDAAALTYGWRHPDPRVDALQRLVTRVVERASAAGEDAAITFRRLRAAVAAVAAGESAALDAIVDAAPAAFLAASAGDAPRPERSRPPRLSESWFCCAEPTSDQLGSLDALGEACGNT